jgi:hypothetical protein
MTRDSYEPATDYLDLGALLPNLRRYAVLFLLILITVPTLFVFGVQSSAKSTLGTEKNESLTLNLLINRNNLILPATPGIPGPEKVMYSEIDINLVVQNTVSNKALEKYLKANNATITFSVFERTVLLYVEQLGGVKSSSSDVLEIGKRVIETANSETNKITTTYAQQALDLTPAPNVKSMISASAKNFRYFTALNNPKIQSNAATEPIAGARAILKWLILVLIVALFVGITCLLVITYCGRTIVTERMIHLEFRDVETLGQVRKKHNEDWLSIGAQVTQYMKNGAHKNILLIGMSVNSLPSSAEQLASCLSKSLAATPIQTSDSIFDVANETDAETMVIAVCQRHQTTKKQLRNFVKLVSNSSSKFAGIILLK